MSRTLVAIPTRTNPVYGWFWSDPVRPIARLWMDAGLAQHEWSAVARSLAAVRRGMGALPTTLAQVGTAGAVDAAVTPEGSVPILWTDAYSIAHGTSLVVPVAVSRLASPTPFQATSVLAGRGNEVTDQDLLLFLALTQALSTTEKLDLEGLMPCHAVDHLDVVRRALVREHFDGVERFGTPNIVEAGQLLGVVCSRCGGELRTLPATA